MTKIFDIVQPTDDWERHYAHMEYLRHGLLATFSTRIEVQDQTYVCLTCKRENEGFGCQYCEDEDI